MWRESRIDTVFFFKVDDIFNPSRVKSDRYSFTLVDIDSNLWRVSQIGTVLC